MTHPVHPWDPTLPPPYVIGLPFIYCFPSMGKIYHEGRNSSCAVQHYIQTRHGIAFFFFRATPVANGHSQARGRIRAMAAGPHHSHSKWDPSHVCKLHHSSWQHWILNPLSRPGNEPEISWLPVRFISVVPQWELLNSY